MRNMLSLLCLVAFLGLAAPAQAQLRANLPPQHSPVRIFDGGGTGFMLNKLFSPDHFRMSHSVEFSSSSFGGYSSSLGMYTNSMMWQFNDKLAARVDIAVAQNFGGNTGMNQFGFQHQRPQVFLRDAEVAWRPAKNMQLNFSIRQSPYGAYMSPYGYYGPGYGYGLMGYHSQDLFWKDGGR